MGEIIGSTYEIIEKLGAGGGGSVYLARHLNLKKDVVLKIDKRRISTSTDALRREVDILKNLKHPSIPQVYDFFTENDRTITVMDFINGESLDRPLKRGEKFDQPHVIKWAKQLLSALSYLHSPIHGDPPKGYVHSDIKPANIMRLPNNDVCLIDFNIALAIGEETIIGKSPGYASPEHYGLDFSSRYDRSDETEREDSFFSRAGGKTVSNDRDEEKVAPSKLSKVQESAPAASPMNEAFGDKETVLESEETFGDKATVLESEEDFGDKATVLESEEAFGDKATVLESDEAFGDKATVLEEQTGPGTEQSAGLSRTGSGSTSAGSGKKILPDVRSDIYSLGATLYHLISGVRPDKQALDVKPLSGGGISPMVADIINKAMSPNPDLRYQTADEMLAAFEELRTKDPRVVRLSRFKKISTAVACVLLAAGVFTAFVGLKRIQNTESALKNAEYSRDSLAKGDVKGAIDLAMKGLSEKDPLFAPTYLAEPQRSLSDALGVYDLSDSFKSTASVDLPSAPLYVRLSKDGRTGACVCLGKLIVFSAETGEVKAELDTYNSALAEVEFVDDGRILYAGADGLTCYDTASGQTLWTGAPATAVAVSGDGTKAAAVLRDETVVYLYDIASGKQIDPKLDFITEHQFVEENDVYSNRGKNLFELNEDGTVLAMSFSGGYVMYIDLTNGSSGAVIPASAYNYFSGGFAGDLIVASGAEGSNSEVNAVNVRDGQSPFPTIASTGNGAVFTKVCDGKVYLKQGKLINILDLATGDRKGLVSSEKIINAFDADGRHIICSCDDSVDIYSQGGDLISSFDGYSGTNLCCIRNGRAAFGCEDSSQLRLIGYDSGGESKIAEYPAGYAHTETRLSADGKNIMQFSIEGFRILDMQGNILCEKEIPDKEKILDTQYRREGGSSCLEVIYNGGKTVCYDSATGDITKEATASELPSAENTVFTTDRFRIESPLHGNMTFFDAKSGKKLGELEKDGYLSYAYGCGEYTILQLFNDKQNYGLILDEKLGTVAYVPYLCDFIDGRLIMDYPTGTIKQSKLYSIGELINIAKSTLEE